jgi:hypothetical protein
MHYVDLEILHYYEPWKNFIAIGWLEPDYPYSLGTVTENLLSKLVQLCINPVQVRSVGYLCGRHRCGFCPNDGMLNYRPYEEAGNRINFGQQSLFVPGLNGLVYIAPTTILHYIREHKYMPPFEFQESVLNCPKMGSRAYYREMKARRAVIVFTRGS